MYEIINSSFWSYFAVVIFTGIVCVEIIYSIFANTKECEHKNIKRILRIGGSVVLVCFWIWVFIYKSFYPIALAKYEYVHAHTAEETGVIESIEIKNKDRIYITIDNERYTIVYASANPNSVIIGMDIDEGDYVEFKYGQRSKFIFDVSN